MLVVDLVVLPPIAADPVFGIPSSPDPVERVADGPRGPLGSDPHDFAGLFIKHKWSFQLHARRFLSDQRDIDEVVQEAYLKLFLALPELETELQALAYARRTITNLCIDRYRADQRRPRLVDLESLPVSVLFDEDVTDPIVQAEDAAIVREALAMLSPLHRAALIKREIEEKSLPQIAAELDIPVEQVKHVLHRARRALRRLLVGTHVEPGVDLDLAMVLEANRGRGHAGDAAHAGRRGGASAGQPCEGQG
jgi:RNA polymerase sigma factor (sigma-70 family)